MEQTKEVINTTTTDDVVETNNSNELNDKEAQKGFKAWLTSILSGEKEEKGEDVKDKDKANQKDDIKVNTDDDFEERLAIAKEKWQEELKEQEKLSKLSPEEQAKIKEKEKEDEIKELKSQLLQKELKDTAIKQLSDEGYPVKLAQLIKYDSKEDMEESIKVVTDVFKGALAEAINEKLKGKTPEGLKENKNDMLQEEVAKAIKGGF
ncbi:MAG: DUF4355 domain-containing protein [Arcobacter sp.]|nr:DUF4355 domain-containing protein [Arcobacter sp.]